MKKTEKFGLEIRGGETTVVKSALTEQNCKTQRVVYDWLNTLNTNKIYCCTTKLLYTQITGGKDNTKLTTINNKI